MLKPIVSGIQGLTRVLGLNDPTVESQELRPDRISVGGTYTLTSIDQAAVTTARVGEHQRNDLPTALDLAGNTRTIGEKFHLIDSGSWHTGGTMLDILGNPVDIYRKLYHQKFSASGMVRWCKYLRADVRVLVQINPTPYHAGCLAAVLVPGFVNSDKTKIEISPCGIGVLPHGYLNCNVNNIVDLAAPFVYTRGCYCVDEPVDPVWTLILYQYVPLVATNGAGTIYYSILAKFENLELHGMMPVAHVQRVQISSGTNAVNLADGSESRCTYNLGFEGDMVAPSNANTGGLGVDHFRVWTCTPGLMGKFELNTTAITGDRAAVFTVTPGLYTLFGDNGGKTYPTPLAGVCMNYGYWRGDMVYHFQVVGTRFHSGRIMISFIPGKDDMDIDHYDMYEATNCLSAIMDISGVFSTCVFRVPFVSDTYFKATSSTRRDSNFNNQVGIGKVIVYYYSKLVAPTAVNQSLTVLVYSSCENLVLNCPVYVQLVRSGDITTGKGTPTQQSVVRFQAMAGDDETEKIEEAVIDQLSDTSAGSVKQVETQNMPIQNKPQENILPGAVTAIEDPMLEKKPPTTFPQLAPGKKAFRVDQMNMHTLMKRSHFVSSFAFTGSVTNKKVFTMPLAIRREAYGTGKAHSLGGVMQWFFSLIHLYRGPLNITIAFTGNAVVEGIAWFTPRGFVTTAKWDQESFSSAVNFGPDFMASLGAVRFNTRDTTTLSVTCPFYCPNFAISAHTGPNNPDMSIGSLSIFIGSYSSADEMLGMSIYWSIPDEAKFYVPRPPFKMSSYKMSEGNIYYLTDDGVEHALAQPINRFESSVDPKDVDESVAVPVKQKLPAAAFPVELKAYRQLRLEVGGHRMRYAFDELHSQAGNMFEDCVVVQKRVGSFLQRGFAYQGHIYTVKVPASGTSSIPVLKTSAFEKVQEDSTWLSLNTQVDPILAKMWVDEFAPDYKFNWLQFSKGNFKESMEGALWFKLNHACNDQMETLCSLFVGRSLGVVDQALMSSEVFSELTGFTNDMRSVVKDCKTFMGDVQNAVSKLANTLSRRKPLLVVKIVNLLLKFSVKMFIGISTSWQPEVLTGILIEMALEGIETSLDMSTLVAGLVSDLLKNVGREDEMPEAQGLEFLKDVNTVMTTFKNTRDVFSWVVSQFENWFRKRYGVQHDSVQFVEDNIEKIEALVQMADELCVKSTLTEAEYNDIGELIKNLRTILSVTNRDKTMAQNSAEIRQAIHNLVLKARENPNRFPKSYARAEPVVIFLHGERGCGKSVLSLALATVICKSLGYDPKQNIYSRNPDMDYWDGYNGQLVCILDDIGQCTDDEDWSNFCQLISTIPYMVNMASLEEKGRPFTSPFVICTSNISNPDPRTIYFREAIERRFTIKVSVACKEYYLTRTSDGRTLDLAKAKADGVLKDLSCLDLRVGDHSVGFQDIVDMAKNQYQVRKQNLDSMIEIWSQGAGVDSFSFMIAKNQHAPRRLALASAVSHHKLLIIGSVGAILTAAGLVYAGYKMMHRNKNKSTGAYQAGPLPKKVVSVNKPVAVTQSVADLTVIVQKNMVRIGTSSDGETVAWKMNALGIYENKMVAPSHFMKYSENVKYIVVLRNQVTYMASLESLVVVHSDDCPDLCFITFPSIPSFRDIRDHFIKESELSMADTRLATLATFNGGLFQMVPEGPVEYLDGVTYRHTEEDGRNIDIWIPRVWRGQGDTVKGSCGGALISSASRLGTPIIGIHVAGGSGRLFSAVITREMVDAANQVCSNSTRIYQVLQSSRRAHVNSKTSYERGELADVVPFESGKEPAQPLYDKNSQIDTLSAMMSKYSAPCTEEPDEYVLASIECQRDLEEAFPYFSGRLLSDEEAIQGIDGMDGIDMSTSPGLPYVFHGLRKTDMIHNGKCVHPLLLSRLRSNLEAMRVGRSCDIMFLTCAKDELRDKDKVRSGKTRAIECCPLDFSISARMTFGAAVACIQASPSWKTGIAVGIDPEVDWTALYQTALRFGDKAIGIDYKNFDGSVQSYMIGHALDVLGGFGQVPELFVRTYKLSLMVTRRLVQDLIYCVNGTMASGAPFTSVINSIVNKTALIYVLSKSFGIPFDQVRNNFKIICYGDDCILVIKRGIEVSTPQMAKFAKCMASLGFTATSESKGPIDVRDILRVGFLKRMPRVDIDGNIHPCLDVRSIYALVEWKRKTATTQENLFNACLFMYHHGRASYQEFVQVLMDACRMKGVRFKPPDYNLLEIRFQKNLRYGNF